MPPSKSSGITRSRGPPGEVADGRAGRRGQEAVTCSRRLALCPPDVCLHRCPRRQRCAEAERVRVRSSDQARPAPTAAECHSAVEDAPLIPTCQLSWGCPYVPPAFTNGGSPGRRFPSHTQSGETEGLWTPGPPTGE